LHLHVHEQLFPLPHDYEIGDDLPHVASAAQTNIVMMGGHAA
jgi:hypothetical protein